MHAVMWRTGANTHGQVGVMRLDSWAALSTVPGAWSVSCAGWQWFVVNVGVFWLLCSLAVPGANCGFLNLKHGEGLPSKSGLNQVCLQSSLPAMHRFQRRLPEAAVGGSS